MQIELIGTGRLMEKRELRTNKTNEVWRRIMKFAYLGGVIEMIVPKEIIWEHNKEGENYQVRGNIEQERNGQVFTLTAIAPAKAAPAPAPAK